MLREFAMYFLTTDQIRAVFLFRPKAPVFGRPSGRPSSRPGLKPRAAMALISLMLFSFPSLLWAGSATDYKNRPLDVRVERLERLMSSQKQLEFLYRLKQLQKENQELRNLLEQQANEIRQLKRQQRQLYQDIDHRLGKAGGQTSTTQVITAQPEQQKKSAAPVEVIDKSTVRESKYGITEREEILVEQPEKSASQPSRISSDSEKPPVAVRKPMTAKQRQAEQKAYQKAYDELRARRYNTAREAFSKFIKQYPYGRYAHIAQYWIAESSYAQRNYEQAIADYQRLLDVYPFSPKKAEAELKKAYSYYELGKKEQTRKTLRQLLDNYPDTTEAGQARRLLKKL